MTDEELMTEVRAAFAVLDPVPEAVLSAAREALSWRNPNAALLELVADARAAAGARGTSRLLSFGGADLAVDIEVSAEGTARELVGRLSPPAPAHVRVRHAGGELTCRAEPTGHFIVTDVPAGLVSLVFRLPDATAIVTSWVRV